MMRYKVKLKPLEPYLFGGENTFGKLLNEKEKKETPELGTYLVKSRYFPQQSAILGMIKKEVMIQSSLLTRKVRGEWVDQSNKKKAIELVGNEKFDIKKIKEQDFGVIKSISPIFLQKGDERFIKKVNTDDYNYEDGILKNYDPKGGNIYDNFVSIDKGKKLCGNDIFLEVKQIGIKKGGGENSFFKKTSFLLKEDFCFAFYLDIDFNLENSIVKLGADGSEFKMEVVESDEELNYKDKNGYLVLLSDAYITIPLRDNCDFAITSELSYQSLKNKKHIRKHNKFEKSKKIYLYEKGSVIINPSDELIKNLREHKNCRKIGYNIFAEGERI